MKHILRFRKLFVGGGALVAALLFIEFLDEFFFGALEAAWPLIRDELSLTYVQVGLLLSVPRVWGGVARHTDRHTRRRLESQGDHNWRRSAVRGVPAGRLHQRELRHAHGRTIDIQPCVRRVRRAVPGDAYGPRHIPLRAEHGALDVHGRVRRGPRRTGAGRRPRARTGMARTRACDRRRVGADAARDAENAARRLVGGRRRLPYPRRTEKWDSGSLERAETPAGTQVARIAGTRQSHGRLAPQLPRAVLRGCRRREQDAGRAGSRALDGSGSSGRLSAHPAAGAGQGPDLISDTARSRSSRCSSRSCLRPDCGPRWR